MNERPLTPELLLQAYASGIFPMAENRHDKEVFWVDPTERGVMPLNGFHISRSLRRAILADDYNVRLDHAFADVVSACADRDETWINATIYDLYMHLFNAGFAHSLEIWRNDRLIGGVYGVTLGAAFFGESMFSRETDGSKIALAWLVDRLRQTGFVLFDTQFLTDHLARLGGQEINRSDYHARLDTALKMQAEFTEDLPEQSAQGVIQRNTQTS